MCARVRVLHVCAVLWCVVRGVVAGCSWHAGANTRYWVRDRAAWEAPLPSACLGGMPRIYPVFHDLGCHMNAFVLVLQGSPRKEEVARLQSAKSKEYARSPACRAPTPLKTRISCAQQPVSQGSSPLKLFFRAAIPRPRPRGHRYLKVMRHKRPAEFKTLFACSVRHTRATAQRPQLQRLAQY